MRIDVHCAFCSENVNAEVHLDGWRVRRGTISAEDGLCPKHAAAEDFFEDQCPGCVAGWPDCPLYRAFAYSRNREMSEGDFAALRSGVCPKRVNGTFMSGGAGLQSVNLSAVSAAGAAIESAIRDYIAAFPAEDRP